MPKNDANTEQTKQKLSHLKDLILLFSIPIGISLIAAAAVYIPRLLANPTYDFIYSYCNTYGCEDPYTATSSERITKNYTSSPSPSSSHENYYNSETRIGYFDVSTGATRTISYEEAQGYQLHTASISPDGYTLAQADGSGGGLLFWGDSDRSWYLENGPKKQSVKLSGSNSYYSSEVTLLGWVKK